jgi:hypothetical protein
MGVVVAHPRQGSAAAAKSTATRAAGARGGQADVRNEPDRPRLHPISCQAYERLLAGETVSWDRIIREHPMLGLVTVTELVNSGAVQIMPDYDPGTGQIDYCLCKVETQETNSNG